MKFRKFIAASTRDCLRMMREALGADAMIVSTRRTTGGVEVVGIRAQDMSAIEAVAAPAAVPAAPARRAAAAPAPQLWDEMGEESVRLSPAARVLATQEDGPERAARPRMARPDMTRPDMTRPSVAGRASARAAAPGGAARPALPPLPSELPLAQWPRLGERQIPHLIRGGEEAPDPARAATRGANERPAARPAEAPARVPQSPAAPRADRPTPQAPAAPRADGPTPAGATASTQSRAAPAPAEPPDEPEYATLVHRVADPIVSEMRSMRDWLARQMDAMTWRDGIQRHPQRRQLWLRMVDCGFTPELARTVAARLPTGQSAEQTERWLAEVLARNLVCVGPEHGIIERGGRYAVVGPTGVGKTTTTAKIAAHCVVRYGTGALGLISTDQQRIGAVDQLHTFGRMLGVPVYAARGANDLEVLLASMSDRRLVLIDTAGMGQRDDQMARHLQALAVEDVQRLLVMPAGSHAEQAEDIVQAYGAGGLAGLIVSKLDEAVRLGGVLDAAIRRRMPVHYMTNGQRVPEDLHAANARLLVRRALRTRTAPVFALEAEEFDWVCAAPLTAVDVPAGAQPARA